MIGHKMEIDGLLKCFFFPSPLDVIRKESNFMLISPAGTSHKSSFHLSAG